MLWSQIIKNGSPDIRFYDGFCFTRYQILFHQISDFVFPDICYRFMASSNEWCHWPTRLWHFRIHRRIYELSTVWLETFDFAQFFLAKVSFITLIWGPPLINQQATNFWWKYIFAADTPLFMFLTQNIHYEMIYLNLTQVFTIFVGSPKSCCFRYILDILHSFSDHRSVNIKICTAQVKFYNACECECTACESVLHCMCMH